MKLECPVCDEEIEVPEKDGKRVECPECGAKLEVTNWDDEWELMEVDEDEEEDEDW